MVGSQRPPVDSLSSDILNERTEQFLVCGLATKHLLECSGDLSLLGTTLHIEVSALVQGVVGDSIQGSICSGVLDDSRLLFLPLLLDLRVTFKSSIATNKILQVGTRENSETNNIHIRVAITQLLNENVGHIIMIKLTVGNTSLAITKSLIPVMRRGRIEYSSL